MLYLNLIRWFMPCKCIYFPVVLFILMGFRGLSQNPVSRNYTVDDGLPSNEVYDIFEDSLGYLWFATDHGISRFDGYEFKNYSTNDGLSHNTIFGFFEDHRHRIWMRAFNSTVCYMENGRIYPYAHNDSLQAFLGRHFIQTFAIDSIGDLWFMSIQESHGLYHQDHRTGRIHKVPIKTGYNAFIRELGNGKFMAGVDFSVTMPKTHEPNSNVSYDDHTWLFNTRIVHRSGKSVVRAACMEPGHYIFSYEAEATEFAHNRITKRISIKPFEAITSLYACKKNDFWMAGKGLYYYSQDTVFSFFKGQLLNSIIKDKQGNYWVTSTNKGVIFIPDIHILEFTSQDQEEYRSIASYKNNLIGLNKKNRLDVFTLNKAGIDLRAIQVDLKKLWIHRFSIDAPTKKLFLLGQAFDIDKLLKGNLIGKSYLAPIMGFERNVLSFGNRFFVSSSKGWGIMDQEKNEIYISNRNGFSKFCSVISIDSSHTVWIGAIDGLYTFHKGRTEPFHPNEKPFRQRITDIKCTKEGIVVVSTRGSGVIFIYRNTVYNIGSADGLATDLCGNLIVEDSLVWVCSNNGLSRISIRQKDKALLFDIIQIKMEHGLPSNLIHDAVRYKDLLILSTGKGFAWFNIRNVSLNSYVPTVYIDKVYTNKRLINQDSLLNYYEQDLSFSFTGLLYKKAGKVFYRYKLEGYEHEWHYTNERTVRYLNLPAGDYTFVVTAMNENKVWNTIPATYKFHIPLHFTKTWWFLLLLILLGLLALCLIIRYYLKQRRVQERMNTAMLLAELKTLRSQMKPHFVFNSLSSIQHFILDSDQESAHLYLSRFSSLMRKILDNTSRDSITLAREIDMLELYLSLEKLRFGKEFEYSIHIAESLDPELIDIPPMLIQPYIENAIWHGLLPKKNEASLWIRFYPEAETTLVCEVEDNGIGRKAAAEKQRSRHHSTGMKNIEERIGILNHMQHKQIQVSLTDLFDDAGTAAGTKVILKFSNTLIPKSQL
jgi:hypothetical protein